ncbi:MAG: hypothetical protein E4G99_02865 [Anaerolineales bacterium]|nr:MAG: hypothetical protein E4G99_02865 [Anaerolineales bacterium]
MMSHQKPLDEPQAAGQDHRSDAAAEDEFAMSLARIGALHQVPERNPERIQASRQAFLAQARKLQPGVSMQQKSRHIGWTTMFRKERSPMLTLARIVVLVAIAVGGTGATAYAAQDSLPDQALYPVKTWIEDIRLDLTKGPQADFNLLMEFVEVRIEEIQTLVEDGLPVPNQVATRLQFQLQEMLKLAAQMDDPGLIKAMEQLQERSQLQVQLLEQLRTNTPEDANTLGIATQAMQQVGNTTGEAIQDPVTFRLRQGTNRPEQAAEIPDNETPKGEVQGPADGQGQEPTDEQGQEPADGQGQEPPGGNGPGPQSPNTNGNGSR